MIECLGDVKAKSAGQTVRTVSCTSITQGCYDFELQNEKPNLIPSSAFDMRLKVLLEALLSELGF